MLSADGQFFLTRTHNSLFMHFQAYTSTVSDISYKTHRFSLQNMFILEIFFFYLHHMRRTIPRRPTVLNYTPLDDRQYWSTSVRRSCMWWNIEKKSQKKFDCWAINFLQIDHKNCVKRNPSRKADFFCFLIIFFFIFYSAKNQIFAVFGRKKVSICILCDVHTP